MVAIVPVWKRSQKPSHFDAGLEAKLKTLAAKRNMKDDTIGPVITWTTEAMLAHKDKLLKIPGMPFHPCQLVMVAMMLLISHDSRPPAGQSWPRCCSLVMPYLVSHDGHAVAGEFWWPLPFLVSHNFTALGSMHYWPPKRRIQRKGS